MTTSSDGSPVEGAARGLGMARCGVRWRYPVCVVAADDDGAESSPVAVGEAETLREAVTVAAAAGFSVRESGHGGSSRFVRDQTRPHFLVSVYPG